MRFSLILLTLPAFAGSTYYIAGDEQTSWPAIFSSVGLMPALTGPAAISAFPAGVSAPAAVWLPRIEAGAIVVIEGESELASAIGIAATAKRLDARSAIDARSPGLTMIWEHAESVPVFTVPAETEIFVRERWTSAPLMAGIRRGKGAVLWLAVSPGPLGYERFPYVLQALVSLGLDVPFRSNQLWAFFDSSYRLRADPDYLAARWRKAGRSALHIAAWHYYDRDPQRDQYLAKLIEACHRRTISVYAWLELPHVSEKFWTDHPEWREKTAAGQDAHLDWRKLMNLSSRDCFAAVSRGVAELAVKFDWDGVNLAELYFESLEGMANPSRFTPMNPDVRKAFQAGHGADPMSLFDSAAPNPKLARAFLDFRADLARAMQTEWIDVIERLRGSKPHLDLVLTHVDDRYDTRMRDLIAADASRVLPLLDKHNFTFLIEDPATIWHLGPQRYPQIAEKYKSLTSRREKLAIDINIVDRYQDVYPTKQQTGVELFQLVNLASKAFERVALYFENSIRKEDLALLPASAARVDRAEQIGSKLIIDAPRGVGVKFAGPALVNGKLWPVTDGETLWLAPGASSIEPAKEHPPLRLLDLNANLKAAQTFSQGIAFSYENNSRVFALISMRPGRIEIDGAVARPPLLPAGDSWLVSLPRGQHLVTIGQTVPPGLPELKSEF